MLSAIYSDFFVISQARTPSWAIMSSPEHHLISDTVHGVPSETAWGKHHVCTPVPCVPFWIRPARPIENRTLHDSPLQVHDLVAERVQLLDGREVCRQAARWVALGRRDGGELSSHSCDNTKQHNAGGDTAASDVPRLGSLQHHVSDFPTRRQ